VIRRPKLAVLLAGVLITGVLAVIPGSPAGARTSFRHPGVLVSRTRLDKVRKNIRQEPYKSAYAALLRDPLASPKRKPHPVANVVCAPDGVDIADTGCASERLDSLAAYADALIWYIGRNKEYLVEAGRILNAYARTLKRHSGDPNNALKADAPLQAAWTGINFAKAAEIVRYSMPGHTRWAGAGAFGTMLRKAFLPLVINGTQHGMNGNWDLASADATISMAVYLDDHKAFAKGVELLRARVPAYFYLRGDGAVPHEPKDGVWGINRYWYQCPRVRPQNLVLAPGKAGPGECPATVRPVYLQGQAQETCRDLKHPTYAIDATMQAAATAYIQGVNLMPELRKRLTSAMEFHARYSLQAPPAALCRGARLRGKMLPGGLAVGYAAYHKSVSLPYTRKLMLKQQHIRAAHEFVAWDTLVWGIR
jgi:hypothetical protein